MFTWFKNKYEGLKDWFKRSETIFLARSAVIFGFVYAGLVATDWSAVMAMNFADGISRGEIIEASKWIVAGLLIEYARRRNATDLK